MEGWRKRISRIAANFEAANKVPQQSAAPKQAQPPEQAGSSASPAPQQVGTGRSDVSQEAFWQWTGVMAV